MVRDFNGENHKSMILGIGTDLLEIKRIEKIDTKVFQSFQNRSFTETEIDLITKKTGWQIQHYAVRFAGKEAVYKAISFCGVEFRPSEIEINCDEKERPFVQLHRKTKEILERLIGPKYQIHISLSYENENVLAFAILESTGGKTDEYDGTDL